MSAQLTLDSMIGIDWTRPTLSQLEQFALDRVPGCSTRWESHRSSMCVAVEANGRNAWIRPSLELDVDGRFAWLVRICFEDGSCYAVASTDDLELTLLIGVGAIEMKEEA